MDMKRIAVALAGTFALFSMSNGYALAQEPAAEELEHGRTPSDKVLETIETMVETDSGLKEYFDNAAGMAVFPTVGKGAFLIGGSHGSGELIVDGIALGTADFTEVSVGLQAGGQSFSEIILFETPDDIERFTSGKLEFASGFAAVAVVGGATSKPPYRDGVVVFTRSKGGLMAEMSVGGQKFKYKPY